MIQSLVCVICFALFPASRLGLAARTLWLSDLTRVAAHRFDAMGYNVPTKALPYAALWAASYVDPTLSNILPNIGVKALTDVEVRTRYIMVTALRLCTFIFSTR